MCRDINRLRHGPGAWGVRWTIYKVIGEKRQGLFRFPGSLGYDYGFHEVILGAIMIECI